MNLLRRFEVLLPLRFNDGRPVPAELLEKTQSEIEYVFGALSAESQMLSGYHRRNGPQPDTLMRIFVDAPDTAESRVFFMKAKKSWCERFEQEEIWITSYVIEVI